MLKEEAAFIENWIQGGVLPSDAFAALDYVRQAHDEPQYEKVVRHKAAFYDNISGFDKAVLNGLDGLTEQFKGRVRVLSEWAPVEELMSRRPQDERLREHARSARLITEGKIKPAAALYRNFVTEQASIARLRGERLAGIIKGAIGQEEHGVVAGYLGAGHTDVYHRLRRDGYQVIARFPLAEEGVSRHTPASRHIRQVLFRPEKEIPFEKWEEFALENAISLTFSYFADKARKNGRAGFTDQSVEAECWELINHVRHHSMFGQIIERIKQGEDLRDIVLSITSPDGADSPDSPS